MGLAGATIGTGLAGAVISANASMSASNQQVDAEKSATATQQQMFNQTQAGLAPYNAAGQQATSDIQNLTPFNFSPTQANLEATPGYQFNLSQGLKSTQNSYAAQGLGTSGAAMKGAASFASGLADTTYQNQFSNALSSYNSNLGRLQGLANTGESAAAMTGQAATQTGANIGSTAVGAANAGASGAVGVANAVNGGLGSVSTGLIYNNMFGSNSGATAGGGTGMYGAGATAAGSNLLNPDLNLVS